jgi:glycosyltransferase involved in cell wall biosynthesis
MATMEWNGVFVHPVEHDGYRERAAALAWDLRVDVTHLHNRPGWLGDFPRPVVVSLHNPPPGWIPPASDAAEARAEVADYLAAAAALLPVSRWLAAALPMARHVEVVPGHVDFETFRPGLPVPRTVVFAGKLDPKKGLDVLLDALDLTPLHDWRLLVCSPLPPVPGFEVWQDEVHRRMAEHRRVDVLLPRFHASEVAAVLAAADVVTVPTTGLEALGLVAAEAQACGRPVVVSDSGGLPETVRPGETGLVVPSGDAPALAEAIAAASALEGDPRAFAEAAFGLDDRLDRLEAVYQRACLTPIRDLGFSAR